MVTAGPLRMIEAPRPAEEAVLDDVAADVVVGFGGYVAVPAYLGAWRRGTPIVIHDDTLDRTMRVAGVVSDLRWGAIQRLTAARVPSLEQVVAWAASFAFAPRAREMAPAVDRIT